MTTQHTVFCTISHRKIELRMVLHQTFIRNIFCILHRHFRLTCFSLKEQFSLTLFQKSKPLKKFRLVLQSFSSIAKPWKRFNSYRQSKFPKENIFHFSYFASCRIWNEAEFNSREIKDTDLGFSLSINPLLFH